MIEWAVSIENENYLQERLNEMSKAGWEIYKIFPDFRSQSRVERDEDWFTVIFGRKSQKEENP